MKRHLLRVYQSYVDVHWMKHYNPNPDSLMEQSYFKKPVKYSAK